jgi:hypothetical protein
MSSERPRDAVTRRRGKTKPPPKISPFSHDRQASHHRKTQIRVAGSRTNSTTGHTATAPQASGFWLTAGKPDKSSAAHRSRWEAAAKPSWTRASSRHLKPAKGGMSLFRWNVVERSDGRDSLYGRIFVTLFPISPNGPGEGPDRGQQGGYPLRWSRSNLPVSEPETGTK